MNATWATKYRPDTHDELVGSARDMYAAFDNIQHAIVHSREAGTGKTTFAHVIAKERGGPSTSSMRLARKLGVLRL